MLERAQSGIEPQFKIWIKNTLYRDPVDSEFDKLLLKAFEAGYHLKEKTSAKLPQYPQ